MACHWRSRLSCLLSPTRRDKRNGAANASERSLRRGVVTDTWPVTGVPGSVACSRPPVAAGEPEPRTQVSGHSAAGRYRHMACHWRSRLSSLLSHTVATSESEPRTRVSGHCAAGSLQIHDLSLAFQAQFLALAHRGDERIGAANASERSVRRGSLQTHGLSLAFQAQFLALAHRRDEQIRAANASERSLRRGVVTDTWPVTGFPGSVGLLTPTRRDKRNGAANASERS